MNNQNPRNEALELLDRSITAQSMNVDACGGVAVAANSNKKEENKHYKLTVCIIAFSVIYWITIYRLVSEATEERQRELKKFGFGLIFCFYLFCLLVIIGFYHDSAEKDGVIKEKRQWILHESFYLPLGFTNIFKYRLQLKLSWHESHKERTYSEIQGDFPRFLARICKIVETELNEIEPNIETTSLEVYLTAAKLWAIHPPMLNDDVKTKWMSLFSEMQTFLEQRGRDKGSSSKCIIDE